MRNISERICRENQNTHFIFNNFFFFENRAFYGIMWKNIVEPAGHRLQYGACALHDGYLRLQTNSQNIDTYCFSTAEMVTRARLSVTLYAHCLSCLVVLVSLSKLVSFLQLSREFI
jgi:hypothetical protein